MKFLKYFIIAAALLLPTLAVAQQPTPTGTVQLFYATGHCPQTDFAGQGTYTLDGNGNYTTGTWNNGWSAGTVVCLKFAYSGDSNYPPAVTTSDFTVTPGPPTVTGTCNPNPEPAGMSTVCSGSVVPQ